MICIFTVRTLKLKLVLTKYHRRILLAKDFYQWSCFLTGTAESRGENKIKSCIPWNWKSLCLARTGCAQELWPLCPKHRGSKIHIKNDPKGGVGSQNLAAVGCSKNFKLKVCAVWKMFQSGFLGIWGFPSLKGKCERHNID